ncbi:hypothetical protein [Burkholderia gladioli]|uniref:hypothetical protein n=1 Tax=Burkholderia gladioli TaxID=28095 RepID=UPI00163E6455|nr:hypothetical protein [Burkholderia gladioli]
MRTATVIVAPTYLSAITGVAAIQISARKIKLMDASLRAFAECARKPSDDIGAPFAELVALVKARALAATHPAPDPDRPIEVMIFGRLQRCRVLRRHPHGTIDVQRLSDGECFRLSGLEYHPTPRKEKK